MEKEIEEIVTAEEDMENNNKKEDRRYYIYEHIRKDNNTCFYVGKGTRGRAHNLDRGDFHDKVRDKYGCRVKIIKDGLTEKEAFALERERIADYVITFGYGAPIDGYRDFSNNYLTNFTWGGEGCSGMHHSEETKLKLSEKLKGENSPMYGRKGENHPMYGMHHSEETKQKISEKVSGEKNGMFGKNKNKGENNPFYGKHHTEEAREKMSKNHADVSGKNNPMAKKVICITTGKIFDCRKDAGYHYGISPDTISTCCKGKRKTSGVLNNVPLQWKYLEDYNNEFKGILINPIVK